MDPIVKPLIKLIRESGKLVCSNVLKFKTPHKSGISELHIFESARGYIDVNITFEDKSSKEIRFDNEAKEVILEAFRAKRDELLKANFDKLIAYEEE